MYAWICHKQIPFITKKPYKLVKQPLLYGNSPIQIQQNMWAIGGPYVGKKATGRKITRTKRLEVGPYRRSLYMELYLPLDMAKNNHG